MPGTNSIKLNLQVNWQDSNNEPFNNEWPFMNSRGWNTERVWYSNGSPLFGSVLQCHSVSNGIPLWTKWQPFSMVWFWNSWDQSYNNDWPFQNWTIGNLNLKRFGIPIYLLFQPPLYLTQLFHHDEEILKFLKNFALFNTATVQSIFTIVKYFFWGF